MKTLTQLKEVTITSPKDIVQLPHATSLHRFKMSDVPTDFGDWEWLRDTTHLQELDLEIGEPAQEKDSDKIKLGSLLICDELTTIGINETSSAKVVNKVLTHLPSRMYKKVMNTLKM